MASTESDPICEEVAQDQLRVVIPLACGDFSDERQQIVLTILEGLYRTGESNRIRLFRVRSRHVADTAIAACACVVGHDHSAILLGVGQGQRNGRAHFQTSGDRQSAAQLMAYVHRQLSNEGVSFVQAMRDELDSGAILAESGYRRLAVLDYLVASGMQLGRRFEHDAVNNHCRFQTCVSYFGARESGRDWFDSLVSLVDATYQNSLDCPAIAQYRSTDQVLRSYRANPQHDDRYWFVLEADRGGAVDSWCPCGCLLLTPHIGGQFLEVTYMGVAPNFRGSSLGRELLRQATAISLELAIPQITLAVDRENLPAQRLYRGLGFEVLLSESVWGKAIGEK